MGISEATLAFTISVVTLVARLLSCVRLVTLDLRVVLKV